MPKGCLCKICKRSLDAGEPVWLLHVGRAFIYACTCCKENPPIGYRHLDAFADEVACGGCGRPVHPPLHGRMPVIRACSPACRAAVHNRVLRARRAERRGPHICASCGDTFEPRRTGAVTCSNACRQRAYRRRRLVRPLAQISDHVKRTEARGPL